MISMEFGRLGLDPKAHEVTLDGQRVHLTRSEFVLLHRLVSEPNVVVSAHDLLAALWGSVWEGDAGAIQAHVSRLRRKLGETAQRPRFIHNVRGVGYRFDPNDGVQRAPAPIAASGGVTLTFGPDLLLLSVEPDDQPFFGWWPKDVIGTHFMLAHNAQFERNAQTTRSFVEMLAGAGHAHVKDRTLVRCADGTSALADLDLRIAVDEHGALVEFVGVVHPVAPAY